MREGNNTSTFRNAEVINDYRQLGRRLHAQHPDQTIVCTIGSWDILHEGHIAYLKEARELGDVLVVGVDSDEAYTLYKQQTACYPEIDRQAILAGLRYVDYVTLVRDVNPDGEWRMELVKEIQPDIFVCNGVTYPPEQRIRLEGLCSGVVRVLPFHSDPRSVQVSISLKSAARIGPQSALSSLVSSNRVFIVHGHDHATKNELELFLTKIGVEPVVLHRQVDQGRTLIEKFEQHSDVGFAFILLTPDEVAYTVDQAASAEQKTEFRARPNVIFEFGYFVGKLGRQRVCCLIKGEVTRPSDIDGLVYKRIPNSIEAIGFQIVEELRAAAYTLKI